MASTVAAEGCRDSSNCSLVIASQRPRAPLPDRGGHRMERGGEIDGNDHVQVFERKFLDRRDMLNPALLTRISTEPSFASASSTMAWISSGLAR
jgi:hypothetical protein